MKEKDYLSSYLEGIFNMASSISKSIGCSYIKVDAYNKDTFEGDFKQNYKLKENINLIETSNSLKTTLLDWFQNEENIVESITYWFNLKSLEIKNIYLSEEKLVSILNEKKMDFYNLEDLFFVEYKNIIFVFLLGNNE